MRPSRRPTPDEVRIWRAVVKDAKPLPGHALPVEAETETMVPSPPPPPGPPPARPSVVPAPPRLQGQTDLHHGHTPGLDRRSAERMKRGEMVIEATLDLHGHSQDLAHAELAAFIDRAWAAQRRCVLVVTGKGNRGGGVLKAQVPRWLNQPPLRQHILGFSFARPHHGGDGALYVLVRRRRG